MTEAFIKNYFPGGNTVKGFYSFYNYLHLNCDNIYIIKGGPGTGKSTTMKNIGKEALKRGYNIEYHWCSSDNDSIDGVVIPSRKTAIYDGTAPHQNEPEYPGVIDEIVDFGQFWDDKILQKNKNKIISLNKKISEKFDSLYHFLKIANIIKKEEEKYYNKTINKDNLINQKQKLVNTIFSNIKNYSQQNHYKRKLFGSAITPAGQISYINNLCEHLENIYVIKGKPKKEKSQLIKKLGNEFFNYGYNVLFLHCGFKPENIEGIIISNLNLAVIDGNSIHDFNNLKNKIKITVNLLDSINSQKLSNYFPDIKEMKKQFNKFLNKGIKKLQKAKSLHDELEEIYIKAMNFKKVEKKERQIIKSIF